MFLLPLNTFTLRTVLPSAFGDKDKKSDCSQRMDILQQAVLEGCTAQPQAQCRGHVTTRVTQTPSQTQYPHYVL